jgi:hypothetical protein
LVPGYITRYTIRINSEGTVTLIVGIRNAKTKELVAFFKDEELEESTETTLP